MLPVRFYSGLLKSTKVLIGGKLRNISGLSAELTPTMEYIDAVFNVKVDTDADERVFVVGDLDELGNWRADKAKELTPIGDNIWTKRMTIDAAHFKYRYLTGFNVLNGVTKKNCPLVNRWETNINPRKYSDLQDSSTVSKFGTYGGNSCVSRGWLTEQTEVHFRLTDSAVKIHGEDSQRYVVTCNKFHIASNGKVSRNSPSDRDYLNRFVLNDNAPRLNVKYGFNEPSEVDCNIGDLLIYTGQTIEPDNTAYYFKIFCKNPGTDKSADVVGYALLLPDDMKNTTSTRTLPISSMSGAFPPIGQLTLDYLVIRPLISFPNYNMEVSYAKHWKPRRSLDIGHRGYGSERCTGILPENTLAAMHAACSKGAEYVEFDVQLTSDLIPIIFHDFDVGVIMENKNDQEQNVVSKVPVHLMSLEDLQVVNTAHHHKGKERSLDFQPFPQLDTFLEIIDEDVGCLIEIKYPQPLVDGGHELPGCQVLEKNKYVDIILTTVWAHASSRRIIFSTFDPDICAMLRLKQNLYPVQFNGNGTTQKWIPFESPLTHSTKRAIQYSNVLDIQGMGINAEDILRDLGVVKHIHDQGLVLFVWGDELNDPETKKQFVEAGCDGIINDVIKEKVEESQFKLEKQAKRKKLT